MISNLLMATGGLLAAFAPEFFTFVACRVLAGFAIAGVEVKPDDDKANSDDDVDDKDNDEGENDENDEIHDNGANGDDGNVSGVLFCDGDGTCRAE